MSAKRGKKKEEKPPPATGPGSKIIALPEPLRKKYIKRLPDGKKVANWIEITVCLYPVYPHRPLKPTPRRFGVKQMKDTMRTNNPAVSRFD